MTPHTYIINHPSLGEVTVTLNPRAKRISGRWKLGKVLITAPASVSDKRLEQAIDSLSQKLIERKSTFKYSENQIINSEDISFAIIRQNFRPDSIIVSPALPVTKIQVGSNIDLYSHSATVAISKALNSAAYRFAPTILLPRAKALALSVGANPAGWKIGKGLRTLGTCSSTRIITLSSTLVFMPQELRDYIVFHELAHLSEMNHSAAFHSICNRYCKGREAELRAKLKNFPYPVLR
ncbi:MAG: M48 family metallopeptidase [Paramuribaculum sp.]|nr:M48 family metallopeptidase [Paramuribaculum sp.]